MAGTKFRLKNVRLISSEASNNSKGLIRKLIWWYARWAGNVLWFVVLRTCKLFLPCKHSLKGRKRESGIRTDGRIEYHVCHTGFPSSSSATKPEEETSKGDTRYIPHTYIFARSHNWSWRKGKRNQISIELSLIWKKSFPSSLKFQLEVHQTRNKLVWWLDWHTRPVSKLLLISSFLSLLNGRLYRS